jgi:hypothetical protein
MPTQKQLILETCRRLTADRRPSFSVETITVEVWSANKPEFGLKGYETSFPDHRKIVAIMSCKTGLVAQGLLAEAGPGPNGMLYRLTGQTLTQYSAPNGPPSPSADDRWIADLYRKDAIAKFRNNIQPSRLELMEFFGCKYQTELIDIPKAPNTWKPTEMAHRIAEASPRTSAGKEQLIVLRNACEAFLAMLPDPNVKN